MYWMGFAEFFHRLFFAAWLPGRGTAWQVVQTPTTNRVVAQATAIDGMLLNIIVLIAVLLILNWMLKNLRRR